MWESNIYDMEASIFNTILQYITKFGTDHWMVVLTFIAIVITAVTFNKNQKFIRKQQFESTFFNMMKQLEDIVSKLSIDDIKSLTERSFTSFERGRTHSTKQYFYNITGRNVFEFLFNEYTVTVLDKDIYEKLASKLSEISFSSDSTKNKYMKPRELKTKDDPIVFEGVKQAITELGIKGYEGCSAVYLLDHYFRYLYRIMRFVDEADFLESSSSDITVRYKYMGILRATLSPYELVFLFYNDLSKYGNEKVKPLIEKYSFFKSLRRELLANTKIDYDMNAIKDDLDNDYDRFIDKIPPEKEYLRNFKYKASVISIENNILLNDYIEN